MSWWELHAVFFLTSSAFEIQLSSFFFHTMSLNIDMKMIRSLKSSGAKSFWISRRRDNDENPENFPLEFSRFSVESHCVLVRRILLEIFNLAFPSFCCSCNIFHLSDTNGISVDTYFCLRPLDRLIIGQY